MTAASARAERKLRMGFLPGTAGVPPALTNKGGSPDQQECGRDARGPGTYIGAGIRIISLISAGVSGRAMNLFLSASDSTRSSPRISSGHNVALGKYWSRALAINSWRTLENASYICNAAGSAYIQSRASR